MRRELFFLLAFASLACGWRDPAVVINAPPELGGASVYIDGRSVGTLVESHYYRTGRFAAQHEFGAPPRWEANLAVPSLPKGRHTLRLVKPGFLEYRGTFTTRSAHVEVYVPDEAAKHAAN